MKIAFRLPAGWSPYIKIKKTDKCPVCQAKLWQAPHGGVYCNEEHTEEALKALA